jgi:predicted dithiol-disulfide oxidoreductase (DUF899 family)
VKIEKDYVFDGPNGKSSLKDLFEGAANSSSITSCSTLHGTRGPQAAQV